MEIKLIYSDLSEWRGDIKDFTKSLHKSVLIAWVYTNPPTKLEGHDFYYVYNDMLYGFDENLTQNLEFVIETGAYRTGEWVSDEIFVKASQVRP